MKDFSKDSRIVLTLDAGGTNLVFSAIQGNEIIAEPITIPSEPNDLDKCLQAIKSGFQALIDQVEEDPVAISFAFPGPADYRQGIIGDLPNLPAFRGGVPLGPLLSNEFGIPVFIQNDGNLFTLGEASSGFLPYVNNELRSAGVTKEYHSLIGVTLGTGFGGGIVVEGNLLTGDNSNGGEVWATRNILFPEYNAERSIGVAAIVKRYGYLSGESTVGTPKEVYDIATGLLPGDGEAANKVFKELGVVLGNVLITLVNTIDACVVIGGGISAAHALILDHAIDEMNGELKNSPRMVVKAFNLENENHLSNFKNTEVQKIDTGNEVLNYVGQPKIGVGISKLGTSLAVSLGAYSYALKNLDQK